MAIVEAPLAILEVRIKPEARHAIELVQSIGRTRPADAALCHDRPEAKIAGILLKRGSMDEASSRTPALCCRREKAAARDYFMAGTTCCGTFSQTKCKTTGPQKRYPVVRNIWSKTGANDRSLEPLILEVQYGSDGEIQVEETVVRGLYEQASVDSIEL